MLVAIIALVVAASGTAVAATKLVSGDSLIKKNSLSGNRLRNHSINWSKVKWSSVGAVPSAKNATNATNATNAGNAATLGGQAPSAFDAASNFTRTAYASTSPVTPGSAARSRSSRRSTDPVVVAESLWGRPLRGPQFLNGHAPEVR
jgi:hypothetical protein